MNMHDRQIGLSKRILLSVLALGACMGLWSQPAMAVERPASVVQDGTEQVLQILRQYPQDSPMRRAKIKSAIDQYLDFDAISRLAVGSRWNRLSPEQQEEFSMQFTKLLFNSYVGDIVKYAKMRTQYSERPISQGYVAVRALIRDPNGPISLDYYLHLKDGQWKAYDVAVEGNSLVVNYRNQFSGILANGSFNDLMRMLNNQVALICQSGRC